MPPKNAIQVTEKSSNLTCDDLSKNVTRQRFDGFSLHSARGERKYLNHAERERVLTAIGQLDIDRSLFASVLAWTGARISEVLALTPHSFDPERSLATIVTLKRWRHSVREVPIPPALMAALERRYAITNGQCSGIQTRVWKFCRMTGWRVIKRAMSEAGIFGPKACPRGLRHAFGVGTLQSGVPLHLIQRWMGHARMTTTSIYLNVSGPEEAELARLFWEFGQPVTPNSARRALGDLEKAPP